MNLLKYMSGTIGEASLTVTKNLVAPVLKTGLVNVLSTALLAALMEEASCQALKKINSKCSVGVSINLQHRKPSAIGANVKALSKIVTINDKSITFDIECFDETGLVGTATHRRVYVDKDIFEQKCYQNFEKAKRTN